MLSNVYIAHGERNGVPVMKVGKTNNVRQRQSALGITIGISTLQRDEAAALELESKLRLFILDHGGKRLPRTTDWFYFDPHIYVALVAIVAELSGEPISDTGLQVLQAVLEYETERAIAIEFIAQLKREVEHLREALAAERKEKDRRIEELTAEVAQWRVRYEALKENLEAKGGD